MDIDSFYDFTPRQFYNKVKGFEQHQEWIQDQEWQRARVISFFAIKGHDTKNKIKSPAALFKLNSDLKEKLKAPPMTPEQVVKLAEKWK
jgi:hypothetical protein